MVKANRAQSYKRVGFVSLALMVIALALAGLSVARPPAVQPVAVPGSGSGDFGGVTVTLSPGGGPSAPGSGEAGPPASASAPATPAHAQAGAAPPASTPRPAASEPSGPTEMSPAPPSVVTPPNSQTVPVDPSTTSSPAPPSPSPSSAPSAAPDSSSAINQVGVVDGQMATSLASDGSAQSPRLTFSAATDPKVIAVLTLQGLGAGTTITYVHIHGSSYTPSQTFVLNAALKHFYVQFAAPAGGTLPTGHFGLRFYVNQQPAWQITYDIQ